MSDRDKTTDQLIGELEAQRRQQHALLNSALDAIVTTDLDSVIQSWNRAAEALYGWSAEEAIGRRIGELIPTEYDEQSDDDALATLLDEGAWRGEIIQTRRDGRHVVVQVSAGLVHDDADHPTRVIHINRDITGRRRAEEASLRGEQNMRAIIDADPDVILVLDINGTILFANGGFARRMGLEADDVVGKSTFDYCPDESIPGRKAAIEKVFRTGEPLELEDQGLAGMFTAHVSPILDPGGKVTAVAIYARDITERKRAEEDLKRESHLLAVLLDNIPGCTAMILKKDTREIVASNKVAKDLGAIPGHTCYETWALRDDPCPFCLAPVLMETGQPQRLELEHRGKWYEAVWMPLSDTLYSHYVFDITEHKQAEKALRASEHRSRSLFEDMPISLWEEDFSDVLAYLEELNFREMEDFGEYLGQHPEVIRACAERVRITAVNKATLELFEAATADDLLEGLPGVFTERSHKAFREQLVAIWQRSMQYETEAEVKTLRGEPRQVILRWSVPPSHRKTLSRVLVSVADITGRKRAEEALGQSECIVSSSSDMMALMDTDFVYLTANSAYLKAFDKTRDEVVGHSASEVFGEEYFESAIRPKAESCMAGREVRFQNWFEFPVGGRCYMDIVYTPYRGSDDGIKGFAISARDITEHKQAEEALRLKGLVFETTVAASSITGAEGLITDVNQAFLETWGYSDSDEVIGMPATCLLLSERAAEEVGGTLLTTGTWSGDYVARRKDGSIFIAVGHATALRGTTGEILGFHQSMIDATENRNLQASLAQSDRLATMGMLAAGVAHEINNPLSYVLYNLESLAEDLPRLFEGIRSTHEGQDALDADGATAAPDDSAEPISPEILEDLIERTREAADGARRIKDIVLGLGAFSRVEEDELAPISLHGAIEHAINMCFNEIKYRARLVKDFGRLPTILASEGRLAQVVLNLLLNAAHAIDEGDVEHNEIRVRTWSEGDDVFFEVRDTGRGIPEENLDLLFEPFFTTKPVGVGSGLGLSICRSIISGYDGDIAVKSTLGEGACFTVHLPARRQEAGEVESPGTTEPATDPVERGRILVVDDEAPVRSVLTRLLGTHHEIVAAESGAAARELLERDRNFNLILCDIMMPAMSGVDLHKWLVDAHPNLAKNLIFMTGGTFTPLASKYLTRVDNLLVEKPFDSRNLKRLVNGLLAAASSKTRQSA